MIRVARYPKNRVYTWAIFRDDGSCVMVTEHGCDSLVLEDTLFMTDDYAFEVLIENVPSHIMSHI